MKIKKAIIILTILFLVSGFIYKRGMNEYLFVNNKAGVTGYASASTKDQVCLNLRFGDKVLWIKTLYKKVAGRDDDGFWTLIKSQGISGWAPSRYLVRHGEFKRVLMKINEIKQLITVKPVNARGLDMSIEKKGGWQWFTREVVFKGVIKYSDNLNNNMYINHHSIISNFGDAQSMQALYDYWSFLRKQPIGLDKRNGLEIVRPFHQFFNCNLHAGALVLHDIEIKYQGMDMVRAVCTMESQATFGNVFVRIYAIKGRQLIHLYGNPNLDFSGLFQRSKINENWRYDQSSNAKTVVLTFADFIKKDTDSQKKINATAKRLVKIFKIKG